jgi:hypothetical protein
MIGQRRRTFRRAPQVHLFQPLLHIGRTLLALPLKRGAHSLPLPAAETGGASQPQSGLSSVDRRFHRERMIAG